MTELSAPQMDGIAASVAALPLADGVAAGQINHLATLEACLDRIRNQWTKSKVPVFAEQLYEELNHSYKAKSDRSLLHTESPVPIPSAKGRFLVVDLGGSSLKVCVMDLLGKGKYQIVGRQDWEIPNDQKLIDKVFFRMIAARIWEVISKGDFFPSGSKVPTGISWSFPFEQTKSNNGFIYVVSKGYVISDETRGQNLADLFADAMKKETGVELEVRSVVNDAVSVYLSGAYVHGCSVGLVLGTGLNASFILGDSVVNSELSFFGSSFIPPLADSFMDLGVCPGYASMPVDNYISSKYEVLQPMEYVTAGRYLGEMFRLGMERGCQTGELFEGQAVQFMESSALNTPYKLGGLIVSLVSSSTLSEVDQLFQKTFSIKVSKQDYTLLQELAKVLALRAARMIGAVLLGSLKFIHEHSTKPTGTTVDFVGSLLGYYTLYRDEVDETLCEYHEQFGFPAFELEHIDDSSILGAAVSAASLTTE